MFEVIVSTFLLETFFALLQLQPAGTTQSPLSLISYFLAFSGRFSFHPNTPNPFAAACGLSSDPHKRIPWASKRSLPRPSSLVRDLLSLRWTFSLSISDHVLWIRYVVVFSKNKFTFQYLSSRGWKRRLNIRGSLCLW